MNKVKFYADTAAGQKNKLFTFRVQNINHAYDLVSRFVVEKGFKIRAAWFEQGQVNVRLSNWSSEDWENHYRFDFMKYADK